MQGRKKIKIAKIKKIEKTVPSHEKSQFYLLFHCELEKKIIQSRKNLIN